MAFRLLDKTAKAKMFAAPIGVIKAGRNRIGAVGQLDTTTIAKAPGGSFSISWAARNDDAVPGTVGLALLDGSGATFARTDGVILSPGEERTLNLNVPEEQVADPLGWADEEVWTIAMIAMAWEDAPDPKSGDFTNLAYSSPAHTFIISYIEAKQKLFTQNARGAYESAIRNAGLQPDGQIKFQAGWRELLTDYINAENLRKSGGKGKGPDYAFYIEALEKYGLADTDVVYSEGWRDAMTEFLQTRDTRQTKEAQWLADLEANGLNKDDLSFADWQADMLQAVVNEKAQKTGIKEDRDAFLAEWANFRSEMASAGFAVPAPDYTTGWRATLESTEREYEDRRAYRAEKSKVLSRNPGLTERGTKDTIVQGGMPAYSPGWRNRLGSWKDTALEQLEDDRVLQDRRVFSEARSKAGFSNTDVRYTSNWRSTLATATSKRDSDNLRIEQQNLRIEQQNLRIEQQKRRDEEKQRRDKFEADRKERQRLAAAAIQFEKEIKIQRTKESDVRRRAIEALRRQQQAATADYDWAQTFTPTTPRAGAVPGLTTTSFPTSFSGPTRSGSSENAREGNRITPVYVSPFVTHEKARIVESSSGNFMAIFDHQATGRDDIADYDDWI